MNISRAIIIACAVGLAGPPVAAGQYFGRNKVQYETFHFQILRTEHFQVYYYPEEKAAAEQAARLAERWYARFAGFFGRPLHNAQPLVLYASHPDFEQTNAIPEQLDEATGGVTEALKRRIVLPLAGPLDETDHVIGHELVHAFQYDLTAQGRGPGGIPGAARLPLWFIEGMAEYLSLGPVDPNTAMWLRDAVQRSKIPTLRQLDDPRYFPYRWGQAFWAFLAGRYGGDRVVVDLLRDANRSGNATLALQKLTGLKPDSLSRLWQESVGSAYASLQQATAAPTSYGRALTTERSENSLNVAPAVSPDGSRMAYFSARGLFSIELYLADVSTGRIERRLTKTALDPHYESVGFISSSGAWDAAGKHLAFGAVAHGQPVLSILDVARDRVAREIPLPGLGQVFNPTWSPDGKRIAFSAIAGGWTDLFVCDVATGAVQRLTDDPYADLQPAWSPDGRSLAFVTDRFTTSLATLRPGDYRLALYTLGTNDIRPLPAFAAAKHINPQWSPDGRALYFVSDRGGISNVYRLTLATGSTTQVTNLFVGASGITSASPVLSVAQRSGELIFTAYDSGGYRLYAVNDAATLAGKPLSSLSENRAAVLPPAGRQPGDVSARLADYETGLPAAGSAVQAPYHASLSLDQVAQPSIAVGADRFGAYFGGGAALMWSDMLGDHSVATALQINGSAKDIAALVAYQNLHRRLNWGVVAQQVPYLTGGYAAGYGTMGNQQVYVEQAFLARQTDRAVSGIVTYPFSRVQRVEVSAGFDNISFDQEIQTRIFDAQTGVLLSDSTDHLPSPSPLTFGSGSVALVYDNSYFGATSPLLGQRYRLQLSPSVGSLTMVNLLADYRRYVMVAPKLTLAARVLTAGRYGRNAEDPRLAPLYLGYPGLVRGYNFGSFSAAECPTDPNVGCPAFDRLLGSRVLIGNAELRFPLLGVLGVGSGYYGGLPIEAALFADAGVAWNKSEQPSLFDVQRQGVTSAGAALRMNLFGFAVAELDYVKPFQRPNKGWYWMLSLTPGF